MWSWLLLVLLPPPQDEASDRPDRHGVAWEMLRQVGSFPVAQRPSYDDTGGNFCPGFEALAGSAPSLSSLLPLRPMKPGSLGPSIRRGARAVR